MRRSSEANFDQMFDQDWASLTQALTANDTTRFVAAWNAHKERVREFVGEETEASFTSGQHSERA